MTCDLVCNDVADVVRGYLIAVDLRDCNAEVVADFLEVSRTTVRRRLLELGTSWSQLKREEQERRLLIITDQPGKLDEREAARICGFYTTDRFFQFFTSVMGQTHTEWRMQRAEAA